MSFYSNRRSGVSASAKRTEGPALKSRSCRTGAGVGRRVRGALGSALPLHTGSACFSSVSLLLVALTVMESKPASSLAGP